MSLTIPSHQGGGMAALELLADPARLQSKIDSLKRAEESARAQVALAGPAGEILKIRAEIATEFEVQKKMTETVRALSLTKIAETDAQVATKLSTASAEAAEIIAVAMEKMKHAEAVSSGARTEHTVVVRQTEVNNARTKELDAIAESLRQKADALEVRTQELEGEKNQLAEIRELINKVV